VFEEAESSPQAHTMAREMSSKKVVIRWSMASLWPKHDRSGQDSTRT
jgi:hypothetical protein